MKRALTTEELSALLEEELDYQNYDSIDVVYVPPETDDLTDEENIDENIIGEEIMEGDIAGTYEIQMNKDSDDSYDDIPLTEIVERVEADFAGTSGIQLNEDSHDSEDDLPLSEIAKRDESENQKATKSQKHVIPEWKRIDIPTYSGSPQYHSIEHLNNIRAEHGGKTPYEIFSLFLDNEVTETILNFSNTYATQKNRHDFHINKSDLKKFIGILILSGYHTLPQTDMYWSKDEDKEVRIVRETMSRNKFRSIKQNIHLSDNTMLNKDDKFSKLTPIFDIINRKNIQFGIFADSLSIDEEMVPYFGRHSCKMFIRGKPVRFGFKLWCLCSDTGYLFKFIPYGGKSEKTNPTVALGTRVVLELLSVVENPEHHRIFFDNFFTSYSLFVSLREKGFFATGTVRENRTAKCPVEDSKKIAKKERGFYTCAFDPILGVLVVRWNDNSVVTVMTNTCEVLPLVQAKRYNRKEHKEILIPQPNVIHQYNKYMGGVDLHDNGIANYRIRIRGKKWWWPMFTNMIDSIVVNSWKIYKIANESRISQLEFRSQLVRSLLKCSEQSSNTDETSNGAKSNPLYGRPSKSALPDDIRFDNVGHVIIRDTNSARKKCRICKSNTIYLCRKCKVHVHPDCFENYHMKK